MSSLFKILIPLLCFTGSFAWTQTNDFFWDTKAKEKISQQDFFKRLPKDSILVLGDQLADSSKTSEVFHQHQGDLVRAYGIYSKSLHQGLDGALPFVAYDNDIAIELYFRGHWGPEKFLEEVSWPKTAP